MGLRMGGGHSRSRLRLGNRATRWGKIAVCLAEGPAPLDAADVSGFSLVSDGGREGAKAGTIDLRRAEGNVDWQTSEGQGLEYGGGQHELFVHSNQITQQTLAWSMTWNEMRCTPSLAFSSTIRLRLKRIGLIILQVTGEVTSTRWFAPQIQVTPGAFMSLTVVIGALDLQYTLSDHGIKR